MLDSTPVLEVDEVRVREILEQFFPDPPPSTRASFWEEQVFPVLFPGVKLPDQTDPWWEETIRVTFRIYRELEAKYKKQ